jgi:Catalase
VPGKSYQAWIRFSNGASDATQPDAKGDARGMAIKLLNVPGEKILSNEHETQTQDFVMINHPVFFVDDPSRYLALIDKTGSSELLAKLDQLLAIGFKGGIIAQETTSSKIASPLETRYWSMVPYRFGDPPRKQAIKFSARPQLPARTTIPDNPAPNFLREAMIEQLAAGEARFDFEVQPRTSPDMSVENSMIEWNEIDAPFLKVATITVQQQTFATPERDQFGENLSFTPWHSLPQHRPLGAINRVRRVVYQAISELRHSLNGTQPREPVAPA